MLHVVDTMEESNLFTSDYIGHRRVRHKSIHWQAADNGLRCTIHHNFGYKDGRKEPIN